LDSPKEIRIIPRSQLPTRKEICEFLRKEKIERDLAGQSRDLRVGKVVGRANATTQLRANAKVLVSVSPIAELVRSEDIPRLFLINSIAPEFQFTIHAARLCQNNVRFSD